ncbi:MAG: hypothetical protein ACFFDP_06370 [Promethearchaeota archaeon]
MKRTITLVILVLLLPVSLIGSVILLGNADWSPFASPNEWMQDYGMEERLVGRAVIECDNGDILLAGSSGYSGLWGEGYFAMRINPMGRLLWKQVYKTRHFETCLETVIRFNDSKFLLVGTNLYPDPDQAWAVCIDNTGFALWNRSYGGVYDESVHGAVSCSDGGALIVGSIYHDDYEKTDLWAIRIDANGNPLWNITYDSTNDEQAWDAVTCTDGGFLLVGSIDTMPGDEENENALAVRLNSSGTIQWIENYGGSRREEGYTVVHHNNDGFLLAGMISDASYPPDDTSVLTICIDNNGNLLWNKTYYQGYYFKATDIVVCDQGYLLAGVGNTPTIDNQEVMLAIRIDENGYPVWQWGYSVNMESWLYHKKCTVTTSQYGGFFLVTDIHTGTLVARLPEFPTLGGELVWMALVGYLFISIFLLSLSIFLKRRLPPVSKIDLEVIHRARSRSLSINIIVYTILIIYWTYFILLGPFFPIYQEKFPIPFTSGVYNGLEEHINAAIRLFHVMPLGLFTVWLGAIEIAVLQIVATYYDCRKLRTSKESANASLGLNLSIIGLILIPVTFWVLFASSGTMMQGPYIMISFALLVLPFFQGIAMVGLFPRILLLHR